MDKLSIFDFLSFFVPGVTALLVLAWAGQAWNSSIFVHDYPKEFLLLIGIIPCYLLGIVINTLALKIENVLGKNQVATWVLVLENNPWLAERINAISIEKWDKNFMTNGTISHAESSSVYDLAFQLLEVEDKSDKIKTLYAQYRLLSNCIPLGIWCLLLALIVTGKKIYVLASSCACCYHLLIYDLYEPLFVSIGSLLVVTAALIFYPKRRYLKMKSTWEMFYAYTTTK